MQFQIPIQINSPGSKIHYQDKIFMIGSCFTEHIGHSLEELKLSVLQNPHGILFDPVSVSQSLVSYTVNKKYSEKDLFLLNELWTSWEHHSRFSNISQADCLQIINQSQERAHQYLKMADWIIITLGSSFSYRLTDASTAPTGTAWKVGQPVANCHRAPAQWFQKHLLGIDEIISALDSSHRQLLHFNPKLKTIFTVSPVRHIRDGVVENNRSKARLLEAVHHLAGQYENVFYFPAYELVIDVLRDYRFYDIDLVHPNYMATEYVLEKFSDFFIDGDTTQLMSEVKKIVIARKHKPFQPATEAHRQFLRAQAAKTEELMKQYPFLDLHEELAYFAGS